MKFSELLRRERAAKGLPQEEAADGLGVSRATLARYERGEQLSNLRLAIFAAIVRFYNTRDIGATVNMWEQETGKS